MRIARTRKLPGRPRLLISLAIPWGGANAKRSNWRIIANRFGLVNRLIWQRVRFATVVLLPQRRPDVRWFTRLLMLGALAGLCALPIQAGGKKPGIKASDAETCGDYGTSLKFEKTPKDAA